MSKIIMSKTGEGEVLIYREHKGSFINLIIDEDLDIELLVIGKNRKNTFHQMYWHGEYVLEDVVKEFNRLSHD